MCRCRFRHGRHDLSRRRLGIIRPCRQFGKLGSGRGGTARIERNVAGLRIHRFLVSPRNRRSRGNRRRHGLFSRDRHDVLPRPFPPPGAIEPELVRANGTGGHADAVLAAVMMSVAGHRSVMTAAAWTVTAVPSARRTHGRITDCLTGLADGRGRSDGASPAPVSGGSGPSVAADARDRKHCEHSGTVPSLSERCTTFHGYRFLVGVTDRLPGEAKDFTARVFFQPQTVRCRNVSAIPPGQLWRFFGIGTAPRPASRHPSNHPPEGSPASPGQTAESSPAAARLEIRRTRGWLWPRAARKHRLLRSPVSPFQVGFLCDESTSSFCSF